MSRVDWLYTVREPNTKKAKNQNKKPSGFFVAILFLSSYYTELLWLDHLRQILLQAFTIDKISRSAYYNLKVAKNFLFVQMYFRIFSRIF
jgi:hypothetical protein